MTSELQEPQKARPLVLLAGDKETTSSLAEHMAQLNISITTAATLPVAMELLTTREPAVVVCDQELNGASGLELLKLAVALKPDAVRILLTPLQDPAIIAQAVNQGQISGMIPKPWDESAVVQTIRSAIEKWRLIEQNQNLQHLIHVQHHELLQTHESLRSELQLGARIHDVLLMGQIPPSVPSLSMDSFIAASREIDGDFFDFYRPADHICDLVVGDVMGKGLPAALVGTAVKTQLLRFAAPHQSTTLCSPSGVWESAIPLPEEILQNVHQAVTQSLINLGYFVTLFYARFNLQRRTLSFVDCGSTKPIRYRAATKSVEELQGKNFPVGMVEDDEYHTLTIPFEDDDVFVFMSDGVTETRSPSGELYGPERIEKLLEQHGDLPPNELVPLITKALREFSEKSTFDDDVTLIVVKCEPMCLAASTTDRATAKFSSTLEQLPAVRQFIEQQCVDIPGDNESFCAQLQLAINEAFCNISRHGYGDRCDGEITLAIDRDVDGLLIELADKTDGFDPIKVDAPSLAGDRDGGYGIFILKELSNDLRYHRRTTANGWNRLQLYKRFNLGLSTMELRHSEQDGVIVVTLDAQNLDARHSETFKTDLMSLVDASETFNVVLDLSPLNFVDSSGLGGLLSVLRHLNSQGGDLKIANMTKQIRAMFEIVRMHKLFEIYNSAEDAVRSFGTAKSTV